MKHFLLYALNGGMNNHNFHLILLFPPDESDSEIPLVPLGSSVFKTAGGFTVAFNLLCS